MPRATPTAIGTPISVMYSVLPIDFQNTGSLISAA